MTVATQFCSVAYTADGSATTWDYAFLVPSLSDGSAALGVWVTDLSGSVTEISPTLYAVTGVGNPAGGEVVYPLAGAPLAAGSKLAILRDLPYIQTTAVSNQAFYPHTVEQMADYSTLLVQQLVEGESRALRAPPGETLSELPSAQERAGFVLGFDGDGNPIPVTGTGGGGGGSVAWNAVTTKPALISAIQNLTPVAGKIIQFTGPTTAALVDPSVGNVTSVNTLVGDVVLDYSNVGAAPLVHTQSYSTIPDFGGGVGSVLAAGAGISLATALGITTITNTGGGGGSGNMQPELMSDFAAIDPGGVNTANNDTAITSAQASAQSAFYWPDGVFATTKGLTDLTKNYQGRGIVLLPSTQALPAKYTQVLTKPTTWPTQGVTGWFRGDQTFTDGGEYKIIGGTFRNYDLTARYFESNIIPHHAWLDVNSGSGGIQGYMVSGQGIGDTTIFLGGVGGPPASWVGKTFGFASIPGTVVTESHVVASVHATLSQFTIATPLTHAYAWNPAAGLSPCVFFAPRTWAGHSYIKVAASTAGGGDSYGHLVRTSNNYSPAPSETHTFMTATVGQYGGDVTMQHDGVYATGWESQYTDSSGTGIHDVAIIAQVDSFNRFSDKMIGVDGFGGRVWLGTRFQSAGTRPSDAAHVVAGGWRLGVDLSQGTFIETTRLLDPASAGANIIKVRSINGARVGDAITVGEPGGIVFSGTISVINLSAGQYFITLSGTLSGAAAADVLVTYAQGGAAMYLPATSKIAWAFNPQNANQGRSGDVTGAYGPLYGNVFGAGKTTGSFGQAPELVMETGTDGTGDFWNVHWERASPNNGRLRLRPNALQVNVPMSLVGSLTVNGDMGVISNGQRITLGATSWLTFNGTNLLATSNGGSSYVILA